MLESVQNHLFSAFYQNSRRSWRILIWQPAHFRCLSASNDNPFNRPVVYHGGHVAFVSICTPLQSLVSNLIGYLFRSIFIDLMLRQG